MKNIERNQVKGVKEHEGKWKIFSLVGLLACFGLFSLIKGSMSNPSQANIEQIKKASINKTSDK